MTGPIGIWGYPYLDLEEFLDLSGLDAVHEEICGALPTVPVGRTGATLKWMGVVAPEVAADPYRDAMEAIARLPPAQFRELVALADDPAAFDLVRQDQYRFGDETDHPLNLPQMRWLEYRHGVYFPWRVVYHFVENVRWEDKNSGAGKTFAAAALERFPLTVALLRMLPFEEIGRCVLFGLEANDHAPLHRDTEPDPDGPVAHSITLCPAANKRFYLMDPGQEERFEVACRAYWFNDMDWHGVIAEPFFRYSLRVDGVFRPDFVARLRDRLCR
jgi:Rieske 2Fe-2S family protein